MKNRLARSAGLIGIATMASRLLGVIRDSLFARYFGAGMAMDAFNVATRVPNLLRDLFAEGAMSAAFVPTFTRTVEQEGRAAAWRLGSQVINMLVLLTGIIVVFGIIFVSPFIGSYAEKFEKIPGKLELTVQLTRVTMPFLTLIAVAAALMGMLNGIRRFFIPSISPAVFNVVMIGTTLALVPVCPMLGWPVVMSPVIGTLLGGIAQIAVQLPTLWREGYRHQWVLNIRDRTLHQVLVLMGPGTIGVAAAQLNLFVNTWLATSEEGAVSWLTYAFRLMYVPIGIFGVSVATAAIPDLAKHAAAGAHHDMRRTLSAGLRLMLMLSVPSCLGLMAIAHPIVEFLFLRGKFTMHDADMVSAALVFYAPGLVGYSVVKIASPSFYALRDARTPVLISFFTVATNLGLNLLLVKSMGFRGLALGTGIAANVNAMLLLTILSRRIGGMDTGRVLVALAKITVASIAMGVAAIYTEIGLHHLLPNPGVTSSGVRVLGTIAIAILVLVLAAWALKIEEFGGAIRRVLRRKMVSVPEADVE